MSGGRGLVSLLSVVAVVTGLAGLAAVACTPADVPNTEPTDGGGGGGPGDAGGTDGGATGTNGNAACRDSAYAKCTKLETCSATYLENRFGSVATCQTVMVEDCLATLNAPGSGETPSQLNACTTVVTSASSSWSCPDFILAQNTPPECATPPGSLADGAPCSVAQQCQSAFCSVAIGSGCGTCADPSLSLHASCATTNCPQSLVCEATTKTCETYSQIGASCSSSSPCTVGLTCTAGANGSSCLSGVTGSGTACVYSGPGCDFSTGYTCNIESSQCEQVQIVPPGGACGLVAGQQAYCSGGTCVYGNCVAYGLPGQPCDLSTEGVTCITGTRCVTSTDGGTSGTCQTYGQVSCQ